MSGVVTIELVSTSCPDTDPGWIELIPGICYTMGSSQVSQPDAITNCNGIGGKLWEPINDEQNSVVLWHYGVENQAYFWIGIQDIGGTYSLSSDSSPITYDYWQSSPGSNECVFMDATETIGWNDAGCDSSQYFACEKTLSGATCDAGWTELITGKCYTAGSGQLPYATAEAECASMGGILAEPINQDECEALFSHYYIMFTKMWIGVNDRDSEGNHVFTSTGTPLTYDVWLSGQPNNWGGDENCVEMKMSDAGWSDDSCGSTFEYVCQADVTQAPCT